MKRSAQRRAREDARRLLDANAALAAGDRPRDIRVNVDTLRLLVEDSERLARVLDDLAERVEKILLRNPPRRRRQS